MSLNLIGLYRCWTSLLSAAALHFARADNPHWDMWSKQCIQYNHVLKASSAVLLNDQHIFKAECNVIFTECGQIVSFDWIFYCSRILVIVSPLVTYWFKEAKVRECRVLELLSAWPSYHSCTLIHPVLRTLTGDFKHHYHVFDLYFHLCIVGKFIAVFVTHGCSWLELCMRKDKSR